MLQQVDLLIVGAGPAGLAHAFWRARDNASLDYRIVDAAPRPGGWVQTRRVEGYLCETGPQGIRPCDASDEFLSALGIEDRVVPADPGAKLRFLARDGRLHPLPSGPGALLKTDIFSLGGKLSLFLEPLRSRGNHAEESLAAFVGRRLGRQAVPLAEAMASGVYGGDAHQIEMAAAFPAIARLEREHGSLLRGMMRRRKTTAPATPRPVLATFDGGMELLVQRAREAVGSRLILGRAVTAVSRRDDDWSVTLGGEVTTEIRARELVLAIPARHAAPLLEPVDHELSGALTRIPYASIANIYLGFEEDDARETLQGFGFLLDRREKSPMLGAIYCSSVFPQSAPKGKFLVRIMAGGVLNPLTHDRDEEDLAAEAETMLRHYTGLDARLVFKRVYKAQDAIPQYVRGHGARVRHIRRLTAAHAGLHLIGNSYDEVSIVGQFHRPSGQ
jgi:protoporphyrinogen/coproporphyrinogen III oxidase